MKLYSACGKLRIYRKLSPKYDVRRGESVHSYANEYDSKEVRKFLRILQILYPDALLRYTFKVLDYILKFTSYHYFFEDTSPRKSVLYQNYKSICTFFRKTLFNAMWAG